MSSDLRFIVDAQLPPALADYLRSRGIAADHVNALGLGAESDAAIWRYAIEARAVLVTKDEDFVTLARGSATTPGLVWIRIGNATNRALVLALAPVLDQIVAALADGEKIIEVR